VCYSVWEIKPLDIIYLLHNDSWVTKGTSTNDDDDDLDGNTNTRIMSSCSYRCAALFTLTVVCPHILQVSSTTNPFCRSHGSVIAKPGTCEGSVLPATGSSYLPFIDIKINID
jgi:hypothetical protein